MHASDFHLTYRKIGYEFWAIWGILMTIVQKNLKGECSLKHLKHYPTVHMCLHHGSLNRHTAVMLVGKGHIHIITSFIS